MKFNNTIAYCKGFYKYTSGELADKWKDMKVCIKADGWTIFTKENVVNWCLHRLDDFAKEFPELAWKVSFGNFYGLVQKNKQIYSIAKNYAPDAIAVDESDLIIWTFMEFIRYQTDDEMFTEWILPSDDILPLDKDAISDTLWQKLVSKTEVKETSN